MKAWLIDGYNGIASLRLGEVPDPIPASDEVVLRVKFAALNPADYYLADGQYPAKPIFPHILGRDAVGVIEAVGEGVSGHEIGDERIILRGDMGVNQPGTLAGRVAVPADRLAVPPAGWDKAQAASASLVYLTAWQALTQFADLPVQATICITGASGGVGVACVQLAKGLDHTVVALSRSQPKREELRNLGADHVLESDFEGLARRIKDAAGRVDLAVDNVGGEGFNELLASLDENGRISCVGRLAGPVPQFNTASLFFRRLQIRGVGVYSYDAPGAQAAWKKIVEVGVSPVVDRIFGFEEVPAAFARLQEGPMGKVVVKVS